MLRVNISPKLPKKSLTRPELILVNRLPDIRLVSSTITTYPTYTFRNLDCFIFKSSNVISFFFQETPTGRSSWLHQVKGKIAQKVEEKYSEYKNEKEMRKLMNDTGGSFDSNFDDFMLEDDDTIDDFKIEDDKQPIIAHSFSDESIVKETEDMHLGM